MTANELIAVAAEEIGYTGKKSNKNLDDKTANITGKYTKYAQDLYEAGYYNGNKNGWDWCCVFVDWCFWTACGRDKFRAEAVKPVSVLGATVKYAYNLLNSEGRIASEPSVGAQIFFKDSSGELAHTGLVSKVRGDEIETIEGNWGNKVASRTLKKNDYTIAGYGLPYYEEEVTPFQKGDRVVLLSEYTYNGIKLSSWVTDGRPLWAVWSTAERTAVTVDETLKAITAVMRTEDVAVYVEPDVEPDVQPEPPADSNRLIKIAELFAELARQFEGWANE